MRAKAGICAVLLALPFVLLAVTPALAVDAAVGKSVLTVQQGEIQRLLQLEAEKFAEEYPEFGNVEANDAEARKLRQNLSLLWQERVRAVLEQVRSEAGDAALTGKTSDIWKRAVQDATATALLPNEAISLGGLQEQNNASFAYSEIWAGEAYGVWTEHFAGFAVPPTQVWFGGTPGAGTGVPWPISGGITAQVPPAVPLPEAWNPTMAAAPPIVGAVDAYYMTMVEWPAPALVAGVPSAIVVNGSAGAGTGFPSATGPSVVYMPAIGDWVDYPYLVVNDHPGNPGPPGLGDVHVAWVEYYDGDGDPDVSGNWFDDPADGYSIWVASANTLAGPSVYPAFWNYWLLWTNNVLPQMHQCHRPSLSVVGPVGTPQVPPSGVYIAWYDGFGGAILVDASQQPGAGAPWFWLGPLIVPVPVTPLPPMLNGIKSATSVTIAVDNGPSFPGMVYIAWSDYATGDADILFSSSNDGGLTWIPPVRVNQDPIGSGLDQWAPHMMVDVVTGDIKITYYDRRNDPAGGFLIETFASSSMDGGVTWTDWIISDVGPTPPFTALLAGGIPYVGDYLHSDFNPLSGWGAVWNDGRNGGDQDAFFENVQTPWGSGPDSDGDGIPDATDNCPAVYNPNQAITIVMTGDVNVSASLTAADIIYLVGYVFKGGPVPMPCPAAGDVNCDGAITAADIIYMVQHVFKGGPAPCNVCQAFGLGWTCP